MAQATPEEPAIIPSTIPPDLNFYTYKSLSSTVPSIRLLVLANDDYTSQIAVKLTQFDLKKTPPFIAISYTWGREQPNMTIRIDGREHKVRQNLYTMLRQLQRWKQSAAKKKNPRWIVNIGNHTGVERLDDESTRFYMNSPHNWLYFWIDALCIDQGNVVERSEQVRLMSNIFSDAAFVLVWLGEEGEDGESAMDIISSHGRRSRLEPARNTSWATDILQNKAVRAFCRRPFWRRLWIVQEVILARDILVCCGNRRVEWDIFESWYLTVKDKIPDISHITSSAGQLVEQKVYWRFRRAGIRDGVIAAQSTVITQLRENLSVPSLIMLADSFLFYECSDVRDKVYGLLGLIDDRHHAPLDINVDYNLSPQQLYKEVVRAIDKHVEARPIKDVSWVFEISRFSRLLRIALRLEDQSLDYGW